MRPFYPGGEAYATHNGAQYQAAEDWTATPQPEFFDISTSLQGPVDKREKNRMGKISLIPIGLYGLSAINKLNPYQPNMKGQLIFPANDLPFIIQTRDGQSLTFAAAALTQPPAVTFTAQKALFDAAEWTALDAGGSTGVTAGDFMTRADSAWSEPSLNPQAIITGAYTAAWALGGVAPVAPFDNIRTEAGWKFQEKVQLEPVMDDGRIVNYRIGSVTAEVTAVPINLNIADFQALMPMDGAGTGQGTSLLGLSGAFTVVGSRPGMPTLTIPAAFTTAGGYRFGKGGRISQITLTAGRKSVAGTLQDLFTFGIVA